MKLNIYFLVVFTVTIFLSSCGKEKNPENNNHKVKNYTEEVSSPYGDFSITYNLSYDGSNRITAITPTTVPDSRLSFTYHSKDHYLMDLYSEGVVEIQQDFFLRNSILDSTVQYTAAKDTMSEKYYYDAGNLLVRKIEFEHYYGPKITNSIQYTYDALGNMIKSIDTDRNEETLEYYLDLSYATPVIAPFFQSSKKTNLIKNHTVKSNGRVVKSSVTTYTFDNSDRIVTVKETTGDGSIMTRSFTYY